MNMKKFIILSLLAVVLFACIGSFSAGWFDGKVESDSFKFNGIGGYSCSDNNEKNSDEVELISDNENDPFTICVKKIEKDEYDLLLNSEYPSTVHNNITTTEYNSNGDIVSNDTSKSEILNESNENGVRIVIERGLFNQVYTTGVFQKDGSYYSVELIGQNPTDKDVKIVNDIYESLESK